MMRSPIKKSSKQRSMEMLLYQNMYRAKQSKSSGSLSCLRASTKKTSPWDLGLYLDGRGVFSGGKGRLFICAEVLDPAR